jgi:soluble lytic murein transglycosylase
MMQLALSVIIIFISQICYAQQDLVTLAFSFSNQNNCAKAIEYADNSEIDLVKKIIFTRSILDSKCGQINFNQTLDFIDQNPNWSQINFIKKRVESLVKLDTDKNQIFAWFTKNPPQTPVGFKYYALSASEILGQDPKTQDIIKQAWLNGSFNSKEKESFLKLYGKFFTPQDHEARMDSLLWSENIQEAEDMLALLSKKNKKQYIARIAILKKDPKSEKMFHALSSHEKHDPGVLYNYLKYKKAQKLPVTHEELNLALHMPNNSIRADSWWELRSYYIRELMQLHRYKDAYKLAIHHGCKDRLNITQAEWLSGWLAISFLHKPHIALEHFQILYKNSGRPISLARGAYWIARSYKAMHQKKEATQWFEVAAKYGHTFYGQMAQYELNFKNLKLPSLESLSEQDIRAISEQEGPKIIELLIKYKQDHLALAYLKNLFSNSGDPKYVSYIMDLFKDFNNISFKVNAAREAAFYGVLKVDYGYPAPYVISKPIIEVPLIYSIIRQESSFDQTAIDPTDGRGLMQLLPSTAKVTAKSLGIQYDVDLLLKSTEYNIRLGSKHLADHINYYKGSYLLGIPAYNAGTHRVDKWISKQGDPRKMKHLYQIIDWIERIPFSVTRDYVHRIMENLQVYRSIVNKDVSLQIVKDLMRKNGK